MAEFEDKLNEILGNPAAMGQIMNLAQSISGSQAAQQDLPPPKEHKEQDATSPLQPNMDDPFSVLGQIDPKWIQMGMRALGEFQGGSDQNTALLLALKPFLREERYARIDKAIQLARISRVVRVALEAMGKTGGDGHV